MRPTGAEFDGGSGTLNRYYVNGPTYVATAAEYYYLLKELYTVAGLADADGRIVELYDYDAYGTVRVHQPLAPQADGDYDDDGDVDLVDFIAFQVCFVGGGTGCDVFDFDDDQQNEDIDDYLTFVLLFGGPEVGAPYATQIVSRSNLNPYFFTGRRLDQLAAGGPAMYHYRRRAYDPVHGRFLQRDPLGYVDGMNLYEYGSSNPVMRADAWGLKDYKIGKGPKPDISWDNNYPYNPDAKPTWKDRKNWVKYGILLAVAEALGRLPDGTRAYRHYRTATGTDLSVDYDKAIRDDGLIRKGFKSELAGAQTDIEREHDGKAKQFTIYSTSVRFVKSTTENWQKALGGHNVWGGGKVTFAPATCEYTLKITVHVEDLYNFNTGQADIATGLPDAENGRFEVFGWAKGFYSRGRVTRTVKWKRGQADTTTQIDGRTGGDKQ